MAEDEKRSRPPPSIPSLLAGRSSSADEPQSSRILATLEGRVPEAEAKHLPPRQRSKTPLLVLLVLFLGCLLYTSPPAFYSELESQLQSCFGAVDVLELTLTERLGDEGPAITPVRTALKDVTELVHRFAREAGLLVRADLAPAPAAQAAPSAGAPITRMEPTLTAADLPPTAPAATRGPLQTRDQALAQLREVADFFRRTEPHSPVAYLADKAASWGEMSLHLWLRTVVKNGEALSGLEELLGVPKPPENNG